MRRAPRLMIIALLGLFLALPVVASVSELPAAAQTVDRLVAQPTSAPPPSTGASAPAGPKLQPDTEADQAESKRKLVMGVASVVLIGLVIWGRSVRRKKAKADGG